jgi:hypothetical protein
MIKRFLKATLGNSLNQFPVVGLLGSRQVGKTTLAKDLQSDYPDAVYLDLELPSDLNKLTDPELYLRQYHTQLIIIDEIQRMPTLFPVIRALVDQHLRNGRFLILGSASPDLLRQASESLAGRIIYHELAPLSISEVESSENAIKKLWVRGGYPRSYLGDDENISYRWREAFIKTYLEKDIPQLGIRIPAIQLGRFWTMLAHLHGKIWNASQIANSLGVSPPTARQYLDILSDSFLVRELLPYHSNIKKRLVKSPKIYLRDSGILHALLNISSLDILQAHPLVGNSWEGFVIEQVLEILPASWPKFFYRTSAGAEIDLITISPLNKHFAIEIKYSLHPKLPVGFWNAFEDLSCEKGFVVYPGTEDYPLSANVTALSIQHIQQLTSL